MTDTTLDEPGPLARGEGWPRTLGAGAHAARRRSARHRRATQVPAPGPARGRHRPRQRTAATLLAAALVVGLATGGWWWVRRTPFVLPDQLGGMAVTDDPTLLAERNTLMASAEASPGYQVAMAVYGAGSSQSALLAVVRGPGVRAVAPPAGSEQVGPVTCDVQHGSMVCFRIDGELGVSVLGSSGPGTAPPRAQTVAEWVEEAWDRQ